MLIERSEETVTLPNGTTDERYKPYTEIIADANGNFSLRVPSGIYLLTTVPPPGGDPNDGMETAEGDGQHMILGHDFCRYLPVS